MHCEYLRIMNNRKEPLLLSVEPLGEHVWLQPGVEYEARICGSKPGKAALTVDADTMYLWGWDDAFHSVYRGDVKVSGLQDFPPQQVGP